MKYKSILPFIFFQSGNAVKCFKKMKKHQQTNGKKLFEKILNCTSIQVCISHLINNDYKYSQKGHAFITVRSGYKC